VEGFARTWRVISSERRSRSRRSPSTCRSHPCRWFQLTEMQRRQLTAQRAARRRSADACESPERTVPTHR
jgi:hypothetical protein